MTLSDQKLPRWHYNGVKPADKPHLPGETAVTPPNNEGELFKIDLGTFVRPTVGNTQNPAGRAYFDMGLKLMQSYQHEMAAKCFLACIDKSPHCALAHGLVALCHSPNYNFKGDAYYESANHYEDSMREDLLCVFPSQQVAERHSGMGIEKVEELRRLHRKHKGGGGKGKKKGKKSKNNNHGSKKSNGSSAADSGNSPNNASDGVVEPKKGDEVFSPEMIPDVEVQFLYAIRILTCQPGVDPSLSEETVGRPYADALRKVYKKYPDDPDIAYYFAESLMVLNAWQLYEFPTGKPVSPDVEETREVLEKALTLHSSHAGLCHMYVHLSEMSAHPEKALIACGPLRNQFPNAGHLIHMPTHIDVLVGDYENCVRYNMKAIAADEKSMECSPQTSGKESFYFGYIVHNYHMGVYGAILGGMEQQGMKLAQKLNKIVNEEMFMEYPDLTAYLESYSALEVHVMIRFGRWQQILELEEPKNKKLMFYRAATIRFAKSLAHAVLGQVEEANKEFLRLDSFRKDPDAEYRILHNNSVARLLEVDATMLKGEVLYREQKYEEAFAQLRKTVKLQDDLNYDEPWGKMQPTRHSLGGLLLEQGHIEEAEGVFRKDLEFHPKNPWALVGLIECLKQKASDCCGSEGGTELRDLQQILTEQQSGEWTDFKVEVACECCQRS